MAARVEAKADLAKAPRNDAPSAWQKTSQKVSQFQKVVFIAAAALGTAVLARAVTANPESVGSVMQSIFCYALGQGVNGIGLSVVQSSLLPSWCSPTPFI